MCYTLHRSDRRAGIAEVRDRDKVTNFERSMMVDVGNDVSLTHHGAFDFQGVAMATEMCQHMIVMCAKTHQACVHSKCARKPNALALGGIAHSSHYIMKYALAFSGRFVV